MLGCRDDDVIGNDSLRDACKKKSLIFCLLETGGGRGGGKIKIVFINPKMSDFFLKLKNKGKNQDCLHLTKNELFFLN